MKVEVLSPGRGTPLRKNISSTLEILVDREFYEDLFFIRGTSFKTEGLTDKDFLLDPNEYFMLMNAGQEEIRVSYNEDLDEMEVIYDPYKHENSEKKYFEVSYFLEHYDIPEGYVDTLPKWYSFKFTYPDYNLIFIAPEMGISIQIHDQRTEYWEILEGKPIILNGNDVHYFVESGTKFEIPVNSFHTVINPNEKEDDFVLLKEKWGGHFDEEDISRVYNPNNYR